MDWAVVESSQVSRQELALAPAVWFAVGLTFGLFACGVAIVAATLPVVSSGWLLVCAGGLAAIGASVVATPPPRPDSPRLHLILFLSYAVPPIISVPLQPFGTLVFGVAVFSGPLAAIWMARRSQIAAHMVVAGLSFAAPALLGLVDQAYVFGWICAVPSSWALAIVCVGVLDATETQSELLASLGVRDPLTGLANRRALEPALSDAFAEADRASGGVALLALDLNGFKALNDSSGHDVGDQLLRDVAAALNRVARPGDAVVRQGGDEFCIVLALTRSEEAHAIANLVRHELAQVTLGPGGGALTTGLGIATYPQDGQSAQELLEVADARLLDDKARGPARGSGGRPALQLVSASGGERSTVLPFGGHLPTVGRKELAAMPALWWATGAMMLCYALGGLGVLAVWPQLTNRSVSLLLTAAALSAAAWIALTRPPAIGSVRSHAVVALTYLLPATAFVATAPAGASVIGLAIWAGPVVAVRSSSRGDAAAHWSAASLVYLMLLVTGLVRAEAIPGLLLASGSAWVLGAICVSIFEHAEVQGRALRAQVQRDPLTGAANRRRLEELVTECDARRSAVLALDLNGFKALNDSVGHAAGDRLLRRVAEELADLTGPSGEVIRQGGDEFAIVLPDAGPAEAHALARAIHRQLGAIVIDGVPVSTGVGVASGADGGATLADLLAVADLRLVEGKQASRARPQHLAVR